MLNHSMSCPHPEGCNCGASAANAQTEKMSRLEAEIAKIADEIVRRDRAVEELHIATNLQGSRHAFAQAELSKVMQEKEQWMKCAKTVDLKMLAEQADHNKTVDKLIAANATIKQLTDALHAIHMTAHCIAKAGPLATPDLWSAWIKFGRLAVMATNAIAASQKTNEPTK